MPKTTFKNDLHVTGRFTNGNFASANQVALTAASYTMSPVTHAGKLMTVAKADGMTITLPAATGTGNVYRFLVTTAVTSVGYIWQVTGDDTIVGQVTITLAAGGTTFGESAAGTDDTLTINGTTSGGLIGSYVEFIDVKADLWYLDARLLGSGTLATTGLLTAAV
jgi:hypothetical protein